jgi:Fe2+ transport system protein FeoA
MTRFIATAFLAALTLAAHAQSYPSKPIRIVVPFTPGGGSDIVTRVISPKLVDAWGQQVVVDNRAGAGGTIGAAIVSGATPDGYTLLITSSAFAGAASLYPKLGDPIPTASGELPASAGIALARLADGAAGTVVHLEDEPAEDYERLLAEGLALGKRVVRHGRSNEGIAIEIDGRQLLLSDALAEGVTVERTRERSTAPPRTLADVRRGESARVARVASDCRGAQRRRLLDLGVVPGTEITVEMPSASGDPTAYRIRGALIALRRQQAAWIEVEAA